MDWLRNKISGQNKRYTHQGFNLDLTYITDRIIAMSYPASGIEKYFRNKIDDVVEFLEDRHSGHYEVYNLSGREYNVDKFKGEVKTLNWEKHSPPSIFTIFEAWHNMYDFLQIPENVWAVHWISGRGRTGTLISWFLIFCGLSESAEEAIRYFERIRYHSNIDEAKDPENNSIKTETDSQFARPLSEQNCRAVRYFELIYKGIIRSPSLRVLKQVKMITIPHISGKSWKPYLEVINVRHYNHIYDGK